MAWQRPADWPVVEGLITTLPSPEPATDPAEAANVAPMGPVLAPDGSTMILRPFPETTTYRNLRATGSAVFHVTDDALAMARGAIGRLHASAFRELAAAETVPGVVIAEACRCFELAVESIDDSEQRVLVTTRVRREATLRPFLGLNRALHAVLEAAILTTRLHLTGVDYVLEQIEALEPRIEKTGTPRERQAMEELRAHALRQREDEGAADAAASR